MIEHSLSSLPNIGKTLETKLIEAGIESVGQLKSLGSERTFLLLDKPEDVNCINMLFALEGAIQGIRWHNLDAESKKRVKVFYAMWKNSQK